MSEIEIPLGRFEEYQRIIKNLESAIKIGDYLIQLQIHDEFLKSLDPPKGELIWLDDYRPDNLVA